MNNSRTFQFSMNYSNQLAIEHITWTTQRSTCGCTQKRYKERMEKIMARKRVVSRTITTTEVTAMVCNIATATVESKVYTLSQKLSGDEALKVAQKSYDTDTEKIVSIVNLTHKEQLYAMPELDFLKYAKPVNADEVPDDNEDSGDSEDNQEDENPKRGRKNAKD